MNAEYLQTRCVIAAQGRTYTVFDPESFFGEMPLQVAREILRETEIAAAVTRAGGNGGLLIATDPERSAESAVGMSLAIARLKERIQGAEGEAEKGGGK